MENYSIKSCKETFTDIYGLVDFVLINGICPSEEILFDGKPTGEYVEDFLVE
tara:strand:+ start:466 stop:621 length:156 start_codon:yes stop_codon:yes gene_type:complete